MNNYTLDMKNIECKLNELKNRADTGKIYELDIITLNEMLGKYSENSYLSFDTIQDVEIKKLRPFFVELASKFYKSYLFRVIDFLIDNNIFIEEAILAKLDIDKRMSRKACFIQANELDLYDMTYFFSYLANIELCMIECQYPEEILEKIIKENPKTFSEVISILTSYVTLNENVNRFQKKLKMQLDKNFMY